MWCLRVPTGAFVARRNGKVFVTGNSGFPKSLDVGKAIDRDAGAVREVVGSKLGQPGYSLAVGPANALYGKGIGGSGDPVREAQITAPATEAARQWDGHGTALKPAWEPIIVARKPLEGTVAANVQRWGCGALAIDASRVPGLADKPGGKIRSVRHFDGHETGRADKDAPEPNPLGRWPANVILSHSPDCVEVGTREVVNRGGNGGVNLGEDRKSYSGGYKVQGEATGIGETKAGTKYMRSEKVAAYECVDGCPVKALDGQTGHLHGAGHAQPPQEKWAKDRNNTVYGGNVGAGASGARFGDSGGASRFFKTCSFSQDSSRFLYTAKASRAERNTGLSEPNIHPTLKPLALTTYLARLILPPVEGARLLVPFCGSGSEMIGAMQAGWSHVEGIDSWDVAVKIARARLAHHEAQSKPANDATGQLTLDQVGT